MRTIPQIILTGSIAGLLTAASAQAYTEIWTGAVDADWAEASNWSDSFTPFAGVTASFDGPGGPVDVINLEPGGSSIGHLVFDTAATAAYTFGSGAVGSQTLTLDVTGDVDPVSKITVNAGVTTSQLFNANVVLSSVYVDPGYTDAFTFANNATGTTLTFAGGITSGGNPGAVTLTVGGTSTTVINGNITDGVGPVALTKTGAGTLIVNGTNTYTGATTLTAGTLQVNTSFTSGAPIAVPVGATLSGSGTVNGSVTVAGTLSSAGTVNGNLAVTGTVSGAGSYNGNVSVAGTGTINLSGGTIAGTVGFAGGKWNGSGSATGVVTSSSGTLTIGAAGNLTAPAGLNVTGGALAAAGVASRVTGNLNYTSPTNSMFAGIIAGTGATVTLNSAATLTLTGANTYTGATTINAGTVTLSGTGILASGAPLSFGGNGTFNFSRSSGTTAQSMGLLTVSAGEANVTSTRTGSATVSLAFSNMAARVAGTAVNFNASGGTNGTTNKVVLTNLGGVATPTGALLSPGIFFAGANYAAYDATGFVRALTYGTDTNAPAAIATGVTLGVNDATKDVFISGAITGQTTAAVNTLKLGTSGFTIVAANILSVNGLLSSGGSFSGGTLQTTSSGGEMVIRADAGSTLTLGSVIQNFNAGAIVSALTKAGSGALILTGVSTYTGVTSIAAGTLQLGSGMGGENGSVAGNIVNNGALIFNYASGATLTNSGSISGKGTLEKKGGGTLILGGAGTYTGLTTIAGGTLRMGAANVLPASGSVNAVNNLGVALNLNGFNQTIATLTGGSAVGGGTVLGSAILTVGDTTSFTYGGPISGSGGGLTKQGSGVMTLAGVNTYTGPTSVTGGTLRLATGSSLALGASMTLGSAATLDLNGINTTTGALNGPVSSSVTLGTGALTVNNAVAAQFDGGISGMGGSLTKSGVGTLTLNGALSYTGSTTVIAGTLQVNGALASGTFASLPAGATLGIGSSGSVARSVTVAGGTVNLAGTMPAGTTLTLTTGTINSLGTGATVATVNLPAQGVTPVFSAPATQELTVTTKLSHHDGRIVVTAGTTPFKAGGTNLVNNLDHLILQGSTTTLDQTDGGIVPGLAIRGWTGQSGSPNVDSATYNFNPASPVGASAHSTFAGTIGLATGSIHFDNSGQYFATASSGVVTGPRPATGYDHNYSVEYRGKILVPSTGTYRFSTTSDDGSAMWINPSSNNPLYSAANVQNWQEQAPTRADSGPISLTGGTYADIIVRFFENGGGRSLYVQWDPTGGTSMIDIPGSRFYSGGFTPVAPTLPATNVTVTTDSTLKPNFAGVAVLGNLTINTGVLTLETATSTSFETITVLDDTEIAGAPIALRTGTVSVPSGKTLTITPNVVGATSVLNKTGAGTLTLTGDQLYDSLTTSAGTTNINGAVGSAPGTASVVANATTRFGTVSQTLASLTIGAGATVTFTSGTAGAFLGSGKVGGAAVVPEPGALGLLLAGSFGLLASRRRNTPK